MEEKPENPYAFAAYANDCGQVGMTLRDWFAGQALAGHCSSTEYLTAARKAGDQRGVAATTQIAEGCYELADAMLAARAKQEG